MANPLKSWHFVPEPKSETRLHPRSGRVAYAYEEARADERKVFTKKMARFLRSHRARQMTAEELVKVVENGDWELEAGVEE